MVFSDPPVHPPLGHLLLHTQNDSYPFRREEIIADSATISFNRSFHSNCMTGQQRQRLWVFDNHDSVVITGFRDEASM
jgi:hypothetical protein